MVPDIWLAFSWIHDFIAVMTEPARSVFEHLLSFLLKSHFYFCVKKARQAQCHSESNTWVQVNPKIDVARRSWGFNREQSSGPSAFLLCALFTILIPKLEYGSCNSPSRISKICDSMQEVTRGNQELGPTFQSGTTYYKKQSVEVRRGSSELSKHARLCSATRGAYRLDSVSKMR
jgi:hypothetical protein